MRIKIISFIIFLFCRQLNSLSQEPNVSTLIYVEVGLLGDARVTNINKVRSNYVLKRCNPYTISGDSLLINEKLVGFTIFDEIKAHILVKYTPPIENIISSSFGTKILFKEGQEIPFHSLLDSCRESPIFTVTYSDLTCFEDVNLEVLDDWKILTYYSNIDIEEIYKVRFYENLIIGSNKRQTNLNCH